jgi:regulator of replication initiation timing
VSDDTVYQWVKESEVAWHAGNWPINQCSIGIEHDATTTKNASEKTYQTAGELLADICKRNNIPLDREHIIKHSEVSATQCPGTLDVDRIIALAKGGNMSLTKDIESEVEEKFGLKDIDRYSKYWTYEELINDWVKLYGENRYNEAEKEKYKEEARKLRVQVDEIVEDVVTINKEINELDRILAEHRSTIVELKAELDKISSHRDLVVEENAGLKKEIETLNKKIANLEAIISVENPLEKYPIKDMLSAIFDRIFKKNV